ncbi:MAG: hypothetical protein ACI30K_01170 [Muribaculaceae bacterium]
MTHLYTLAGISFSDAEYEASFGHLIDKNATDTLRRYAHLLQFGRSVNGLLAGPFFFGIAAADLPDAAAMSRIVAQIDSVAIATAQPDSVRRAVNAIGKVYIDNYEHYLSRVYPTVRRQLEPRIAELNALPANSTIISDWQRALQQQWPHGDYHFKLFRAGADGPSFNDIGPATNTLYYNMDTDYTAAMFSHEFGIFMMRERIMPLFAREQQRLRRIAAEYAYVPWMAFESLACWYGCKIAGGESADVKYFRQSAEADTFMNIYSQLEADGCTDYTELYLKAIKEYLSRTAGL